MPEQPVPRRRPLRDDALEVASADFGEERAAIDRDGIDVAERVRGLSA